MGIEKGLQAMVQMEPACDFAVHLHQLQSLEDKFGAMNDEFGGDILENCKKLVGAFRDGVGGKKEEL